MTDRKGQWAKRKEGKRRGEEGGRKKLFQTEMLNFNEN